MDDRVRKGKRDKESKAMIQIIIMILATAVVAEFGIHVLYHWKTGKAGLLEPPFEYLKDIYAEVQKRKKKRI